MFRRIVATSIVFAICLAAIAMPMAVFGVISFASEADQPDEYWVADGVTELETSSSISVRTIDAPTADSPTYALAGNLINVSATLPPGPVDIEVINRESNQQHGCVSMYEEHAGKYTYQIEIDAEASPGWYDIVISDSADKINRDNAVYVAHQSLGDTPPLPTTSEIMTDQGDEDEESITSTLASIGEMLKVLSSLMHNVAEALAALGDAVVRLSGSM